MRKGLIAGLAALLMAGAGFWYWLSPAMAMGGLRDAALAGDRTELAERVDFPLLRESMKEQLRTAMSRQLGSSSEQNGLGALGAMLLLPLVNRLVDTMVTPDGLKVMLEAGRLAGPVQDAGKAGGAPAEWSIARDGLSRFRATPEAKPGESAPSLVFERDGLGWKLTGIEIPADSLSSSPGGAQQLF